MRRLRWLDVSLPVLQVFFGGSGEWHGSSGVGRMVFVERFGGFDADVAHASSRHPCG